MRLACALNVLILAALAAPARGQDAYESEPPPRETRIPSAGFWPTARMMDLFIDRLTEEMSRHYNFDEDQLWNTRDIIKERFPAWLEENRAEIQSLMNQYFESLIAGEPPTPDDVALWAQRASPLVEEFAALVEVTADEMGETMTDEQRVLLEGEKAAFHVGLNFLRQRLTTWGAGGFDWQTEWPRSEEFQRRERDRHERLDREINRAKAEAMGQPVEPEAAPATAGVPEPTEARSATSKPTPTKKDDWETYVEQFIRRYQLDEAQSASARRFLREQQEDRDRYLKKKLPDINTIETRLRNAQTDEDREKIRAELERLNRPIERYFDRLKERLETLPTRKQRAAAAQTEMAERARAEGAAKGKKLDATSKPEKPAGETE